MATMKPSTSLEADKAAKTTIDIPVEAEKSEKVEEIVSLYKVYHYISPLSTCHVVPFDFT